MRAPKAVIKCRRCHQSVPLNERVLEWFSGTGRRSDTQYLKPASWCDSCYEKEMEKREIDELEAWPDLEETLEVGTKLLKDDELEDDASPEGSFLMPGEETKW